MRGLANAFLLVVLAVSAVGCGSSSEPITDPSKLIPLTEEQKKEARSADDQLADEEHVNPTKAVKGSAKSK